MATARYDAKQFTQDELKIINEALIFTLNCLDRDQTQLYNSVELVLAKTTRLLKED